MSPETKLKVAAEEIKEILKKYDIAGAVQLHTPGHAEYFIHLNPSYSCAYRYNENEVRFYCKRVDFPTQEAQIQKLTDTANMLQLLTDVTAFNFGHLHALSKTINKETNAQHF